MKLPIAAVHESGLGTELPIPNVRFHGEPRRISGRAADIAKTTFMTRNGHPVVR
jgi:hypothetical protein